MNTFTNLSTQAKIFHDRTLLLEAKDHLFIMTAARMANIPKNDGNSIQYRRYSQLAVNTTPLSEGVTPTGGDLTQTSISATVAQYGNFTVVSDRLDLMGIDPVITDALRQMAQQAGESLETVCLNELVTGTNVRYVTGSARNAQTTSSLLTSSVVQKAIRDIHATGKAKPFMGSNESKGLGGRWFGYINTYVWYDYRGDADIKNTFIYSQPERMEALYFNDFDGVMWHATNLAPKFAAAGASSNDVYATFIMGKEYFGCINVGGTGRFQTFTQQLGSGGTSDPLHQRATIGYKFYQAPKILNNGYGIRIESGASA
jgi:N4-gp56 family major capsid protein